MVPEGNLDGNVMKERDIHGESNDEKTSTDFMFMLDMSETIDQLVMPNIVRWFGHVSRRALDFEVEGQRKNGRP